MAISTDEKTVNQARRAGAPVQTQLKWGGGKNTPSNNLNAKKLEQDDLSTALPKIAPSFAQALQRARMDKKMTQADLAKAINEKTSVVNDYESGRAVPSGVIISKLQRALGGVKLPKAVIKPPPARAD